MTIQEIKEAVDKGLTVHWSNTLYKVVKDKFGDYLILCTDNGYCTGLCTKSNGDLIEDENKFFIA